MATKERALNPTDKRLVIAVLENELNLTKKSPRASGIIDRSLKYYSQSLVAALKHINPLHKDSYWS